ncbi:hypothetical protein ERD78_18905 [Allopusillimonas soli]|uniref:Uncharacterized protein n=1 Tax=Allopusillimonas soli TaxID=659016 RepID=A0A853FKF8_9BURK|nr:hypothetical protein [Allopusillimonas soli]NYT38861.1 hypothetical protein [Allopusillimonas soli]TEA70139.1 hypothetical protein ERD78_18905 [Allopusillimonas soli]
MNRTNIEHAAYAVLMQAVIGLISGNWWIGAAFGAAFFLGREHAQREYHLGDPSHLPPWRAFDVWNWTTDARLDLLCPVAAVLVLAGVAGYVEGF